MFLNADKLIKWFDRFFSKIQYQSNNMIISMLLSLSVYIELEMRCMIQFSYQARKTSKKLL